MYKIQQYITNMDTNDNSIWERENRPKYNTNVDSDNKKTIGAPSQTQTMANQLAFLSLCRMGFSAGEAILFTSTSLPDLFKSPWVSKETRKQYKVYEQWMNKNKKMDSDRLNITLVRMYEELTFVCLAHALTQDIHIQVNQLSIPCYPQ